ncbi:MAG: type IX secretion system membrane protein PorP/SprF, partial [Saprospiraceae bacterium]
AGDAGLSWTQIGLSGSLAQTLGESQTLVAGLALALVQRSFDIQKLKFKNQWSGDVYDASLPTGESFGRSSGLAPSLSAGLLWQYARTDTRNHLEAGLGAAHLNRPVINFRDDTPVKLPLRFNLQLQGARQLNDRLDLVGFGWAQQLTKTREIVIGAGLRRVLTTGPANTTALQFSLATRVGDAFIPAVQLERNNWTVGLSYDWNVSGFQVATGHRGGFEIAAVYHYVPVPPIPVSKSCPIF